MTKFKYSQADWKPFVLIGVISSSMFPIFKTYFGGIMLMLFSVGYTVIVISLISKYFISVVKFNDTYFVLKEAFKKEIKVPYSNIIKITFSNDRFLNLFVYTTDHKFKLPPPARLPKAKELFKWLGTKNLDIQVEILK
jgi:hypothetical protein